MIYPHRIRHRPDRTVGFHRIWSIELMKAGLPIVVFSDVDGVRCDPHGGSFRAAADTLEHLGPDQVPLVLCSSKTRAEIEEIQQESGFAIPSCAKAAAPYSSLRDTSTSRCRGCMSGQATRLSSSGGLMRRSCRPSAARPRRLRIEIVGFNDMSVEEVARECHLTLLRRGWRNCANTANGSACSIPSESTRSRLAQSAEGGATRSVAGERSTMSAARWKMALA